MLALILGAASLAGADEGDVTLALQPGYGFVAAGQGVAARSLSAGGGTAAVVLGVSETLALRLAGAVLGGSSLTTWSAGLGLSYALDLLRVVPFFEAGLGVVGTHPGPGPRAALALQVGLGAEYLLTRQVALGGSVRYQVALSDPGALPFVLTLGPQLSLKLR